MSPICMLHNNSSCAKEKTIHRAQADNRVRIIYGYDWHTYSDNLALVYDHIQSIIDELKPKYSNSFMFNRLGAKDGSIYCDICRQIQSADIAIFDLSTNNLNVIFELGLAIGTGKHVFILRSKHYKSPKRSLSDLNGILEYRFSRRSGHLSFEADFRRSLLSKLHIIAKRHLKAGAA
jgi:nucleoside 2-deoxyribosyltransferase